MDQTRIQEVDPFCTEAIALDARDKDRLRSLGLEEMDAVVVSSGEEISTSVLVTLYLQEIGVTAQAAHKAGKLPEDAWNTLRQRFNALQELAIREFGKESLQEVLRSLSPKN